MSEEDQDSSRLSEEFEGLSGDEIVDKVKDMNKEQLHEEVKTK